MLTIAPPPCRSIAGMTCFMARKQLLRLTAKTRSQTSSESSTTPPTSTMPTLLSSTSMRPKRSRQAATARSTSADRDASACQASASPPSPRMISTVSRAAPSFTSTQKTRAPSRAKSTAVALPLPQPGPTEPAPITSAVLPASRPAMPSSGSAVLEARLLLREEGAHPFGAVFGREDALAHFERRRDRAVLGHVEGHVGRALAHLDG